MLRAPLQLKLLVSASSPYDLMQPPETQEPFRRQQQSRQHCLRRLIRLATRSQK